MSTNRLSIFKFLGDRINSNKSNKDSRMDRFLKKRDDGSTMWSRPDDKAKDNTKRNRKPEKESPSASASQTKPLSKKSRHDDDDNDDDFENVQAVSVTTKPPPKDMSKPAKNTPAKGRNEATTTSKGNDGKESEPASIKKEERNGMMLPKPSPRKRKIIEDDDEDEKRQGFEVDVVKSTAKRRHDDDHDDDGGKTKRNQNSVEVEVRKSAVVAKPDPSTPEAVILKESLITPNSTPFQPAQTQTPTPTPTNDLVPAPVLVPTAPKPKFDYNRPREAPPLKGLKPLPSGASNCLDSLTFCLTGVLESLEREDASDLIKMYGGKVVGTPSSRVDYMVVGTAPGESKLSKAKDMDLKIIDENGLFKIISEAKPGEFVAAKSAKSAKSPASKKKASAASNPVLSLSPPPATDLWVNKYKPRSMSELCANPGIVGQAKQWLLKWKETYGNQPALGKGKMVATGAKERAMLFSGPPGIGKTTLAHVVCRECGFEAIEFNASDVRSKSALQEQVVKITGFTESITSLWNKQGQDSKSKGKPVAPNGLVLIMDEVDGMSSGDRGGNQELIAMIKKSKVPIICIANDDASPKTRTLANYCLKLKFRRPMAGQVRDRLRMIVEREGYKGVDNPTLDKLAESCQGDIRQMINCLQIWRMNTDTLGFMDVKSKMSGEGKTSIQLSIFDIYGRYFSGTPAHSFTERLDAFFMDYDLVPLFVHENYIGSSNQDLSALAEAADSISEADVVNRSVRMEQSWELLPAFAVLSAIRPTFIFRSMGRPNFPQFLGKISTTNKNIRLARELQMHLMPRTGGGSWYATRLDYMPAFAQIWSRILQTQGEAGVSKVVDTLTHYYLGMDDFESVIDCMISNDKIPANTLKLLRAEDKEREEGRLLSTVEAESMKKGDKKSGAAEPGVKNPDEIVDPEPEADDEDGDGGEDGEDDGAVLDSKDKMVKAKKPAGGGRAKGKGSAAGSKKAARGGGKGKATTKKK